MKCCIIPEGESKGHIKRGKMTKGSGTGSKLAKAAHKCKGKKKDAFRKCVKAKIKKL